MSSRAWVIVMSGVLVACSSPDLSSQQCERAAIVQADAEQRWLTLLADHEHTDSTLASNPDSAVARAAHDESAEELLGARVDMILAEATTRHHCG